MTVRVRVLGGLAVDGVNLATLSSRKARRVLARLAIARGSPVGVDALADVVWSNLPSQPADQLAVLVSRLRSLLGPDRIVRGPAGYILRADWLDLTALVELTSEARRRLDAGAAPAARIAARAAIELLRGPVLPEEPPETGWLEAERADAARTAAAARLVAAEAALAAGDAWAATELAESALAAEPYDEAALRALMSAHRDAGRPALALRAYADMAQRLGDELGVDPAQPTQALHVAILRAEPAAAPPAPAAATLPGRTAELAALVAAYERAAAGHPTLVLVEGEAGIGKTRLLGEFTAGLAGARVLACRGVEHAGGLPLQPLLDALAAHLRTSGAGDAAELPGNQLLGNDAEFLGDDAGIFGGDAGILGGDAAPIRSMLAGAGPPVSVLADVQIGLSTVFAAYDTVITRIARAGPVVLTIDDVQWADTASRAWLHHAVHRLAGVPLLIIAARRSGEGAALGGDAVVRLGLLDRAATAAVLGLPVDSPEVARLHERSGGHPLFLRELARSRDTGADAALPASIRDAIVDRCERAGPAVAATLRAAAVLGPDIDLELLATVLEESVPALLDHLEEGARRQLLVESGPGFGFAHELVRDAVRTGTGAARARLLHRQAARILGDRRRSDPLAVALHARLGDDSVLAATALARAADIAAGRYDLDEAVRLLDEAVALDSRPELLLRRARIRLRRADTIGATADVNAARERLTPDDPQYAAALEVAALVAYLERDVERCRRLADEGAALAVDPEVRASCRILAGRLSHAVGDLPQARELFETLGAEAPASVAPLVETWRGFLLVHSDEPARALRLVSAAQPAQGRVGYPFSSTSRHMVAGYAHALLGEPYAALREFDRMASEARRQATDHFTGRDDNFRAWVLRSVGEYGAAEEANLRAYEAARAHDLAEPTAHALLDLADGRLRAGDPAGAGGYLDRLRADIGSSYLFQWRTELRRGLVDGRCSLALGEVDAAAESFAAVRDTARRLGLRRYDVLSRLWQALALHTHPADLASDVDALVAVAPLEAWWLTAELARAFDVDPWRRLSIERADDLARKAGPHGDALRRAASAPPPRS